MKSAKVGNRVITDEITFPAKFGVVRDRVGSRGRRAARDSDLAGNDRNVRRPPVRGRPLHTSKAKRGHFEKISADVPGVARFQSPLLYAARR